MTGNSSIFHLVCPNGLGHFKRTAEIWARLISTMNVRVTIACEEWQHQRSSSTAAVQLLNGSEKVSFEFMDMKGVLKWQDDPSQYSLADYENALDLISAKRSFKSADLVLSDNLAGVAGKHSNVILLGSFMWHDVLENSFDNPPLDIVTVERQLLEKHKPVCISVGEITMPAVKSSTENTGLNWFCDKPYVRPEKDETAKYNVLFSTGLSGASNQRLKKLYDQFSSDPRFAVFGTPVFKERFHINDNPSVGDFDFSEEAFQKMNLLIARPGIGSITEAIRFRIPIIAVDNGVNTEMIFNASRVEELGIGWDAVNRDVTTQEVLNGFEDRLSNLKERPLNGFDQLKDIIQNALVLESRRA